MTADLVARARAWIEQDPDPVTRSELEALLAAGPDGAAELAERFQGPLTFGTAGLRGILGAGESRMNRAVVIRTTHGLGRSLLDTSPDLARRGVVVGYDGRILSRELAEETAATLLALEIPVTLSTTEVPTPVVAYAVEHLNAAAGVIITASHNPPEYNGYKVYAQNGAQIIPPQDAQIAAAITATPGANDVGRRDLPEARAAGLLTDLEPALIDDYLTQLKTYSVAGDRGRRDLTIVYTPLHGVGGEIVPRALQAAGFEDVHTVPEQREPDGRFPTVAFPNPEEKGALDLALALAKAKNANLIFANDPDVDRLAACVQSTNGDYVQLTGNDLGVLLGHYLLTEGAQDERLVMNTIVSSPLLGQIAKANGVRFEETLTGFKWIANRALELKSETRFVFGYEEALGYTVGMLVHDKDGIGAAVALAELAAILAEKNQTLLDRLAEICQQYGLYVSGQKTKTFPGAEGQAKMAQVMDTLRSNPPKEVAGLKVERVRDYQLAKATAADGTQTDLDLPKSNVLAFDLEAGNRVIARPSGTEPKLKLYVDACEPLQEGTTYLEARTKALATMEALGQDFAAKAGI